jgi:hypothetical protein
MLGTGGGRGEGVAVDGTGILKNRQCFILNALRKVFSFKDGGQKLCWETQYVCHANAYQMRPRCEYTIFPRY